MALFHRQPSLAQQGSSHRLGGRRARRRKLSSDDDVIELDSNKAVADNVKDILVHLARNDGKVGKVSKLAYLNAFVRYYMKQARGKDLGFTNIAVLFCLRSCMLHRHSVVRAATFRCLRYFIDSNEKVAAFFELKLDWCVARSLDMHTAYDVERTQAVRLCRHLLELNPSAVQPAIILPFIAIAGHVSKTNDRMVLMALQFLCELAYKNPSLLAQCDGVQAIVQHIMQCHNSPRINESLLQTILYLLNVPQTRICCSPFSGLDQLLAPFTDSHYRHQNDSNSHTSERADQKAARFQEERLLRCHACSQALLSALHTWPGLVVLSNPHNTAMSSLVNSLQISSHATQKIMLQLIYNVFHLRLPKSTQDFEEALISCDPCTPEFSWNLKEGFVAAECLSSYKEISSRPNLIDNHLALLLSTFIIYGMLEALCEVVIQSDRHNSIWATILLGELLHMSYILLPWSDSEQTHYLPALISASNSSKHTRQQRLQAHQAVQYLDRLHTLKKRGKPTSSLHLELLISFIPESQARVFAANTKNNSKDRLDHYLPQETEDSLLQQIRESGVLVEPNYTKWRWISINSILKSKDHTLKRVDDFTLHRFLAKLLHFYNPSADNGYSTIKLSNEKARLYTSTGLLLLEKILFINADESHRHLHSLLIDLCHSLSEIRQETPAPGAKLGLDYIYSHCCQNYFLFIGKLSQYADGQSLLEATGIMQQLLDLVTITSQEAYVKLTVSSLDYTKEGLCRVILSKALTATSENARLYTADFMRALLRLGVPFFSSWCMELLIKQLYDQSKNVSMRSLSVLNEACEDQANLLSLIEIRPSVLHLGEMGCLLVTRYLSVQKGFQFLRSSDYLEKELSRWHESFNVQYADVVDNLLAESLSSYERSFDDEVRRRSSVVRRLGKNVYVPPHLYGQLIQHSEGSEIVLNLPYLHQYFDIIRAHCESENTDIKQCKAAIWATGHIGSSIFGLAMLDKQDMLRPLISITERSQVFTLRGTAFYALGLIASTRAGVQRLAQLGWRSVMNDSMSSEEWPVLSSELLFADPDAAREIRSLSQDSSASQTSVKSDSTTDTDSSRFEFDEGARSRTSTDERADSIRTENNGYMYEEATSLSDFEPAVRSGKAHSTSELIKSNTRISHRRCSSDSLSMWSAREIPTVLIEDEKLSNAVVPIGHVEDSPGAGDGTVNTQANAKPAIRHKASKSLVDMMPEPAVVTKSRSLSWRSDVRQSASSNNVRNQLHIETLVPSHLSSTDSAISQSISPIETSKPISIVEYTMSLTRKRKPINRNTKFSSLQYTKTSQDRGVYITHKDELGQAAVRAMRRQASNASSCASPSQASPTKLASKSSKMIKTLNTQGDIDTLTEARKMSNIAQPFTSFTIRYMGLALPRDVINIFEVRDNMNEDEDEERRAALSTEKCKPASLAIEGLELHSPSNCLACVLINRSQIFRADISAEENGFTLATQPMFIGRHVDGQVSESSPIGRALLRKECIKFVTTICSSIGVNAAEEGLLRLKEQFPDLFQDVCLYSEISAILSSYNFHLPARRFIQELFQETNFEQLIAELMTMLNIDVKSQCCETHAPESSPDKAKETT